MMWRIPLAAVAASMALQAGPATAAVIHELPAGAALSFAGTPDSRRLDDGRFVRDYDGFTFAAEPAPRTTNNFVRTSIASFDYGSNGVYSGPLITMSGYDRALFEFTFDAQQSAVLFDLNWLGGLNAPATVLSIYDSLGRLLETTTLDRSGPHGLVGFGDRSRADIAKLNITGNAFGLRNLTVSDAVPIAGVPEPASWAMMILGFFGLGGLLRSKGRRGLVAAS